MATTRVVTGAAGVGILNPHRAAVVQAAGCLVWRVNDGELQVQIIHRPRYNDWSWPKGKVDPGETLAATAAREVAEETGKPVMLGMPLPGLQYLTADEQVKQVHYWAATRIDAQSPALVARYPVAPVSPDEIDGKAWVTPDEAITRLSRKSDRAPLEALLCEYEQGRLATRTIVIARHGSALPRSYWFGTEEERPLTPTGYGQAHALVPLLGAYGITKVVTSQWRRCSATVNPYVLASAITPTVDPALTEAAHERDPERVAQAVTELLNSPESALLCTHRPVLPTVIKVLAAHAHRGVRDALPARNPYLQPGEALIAHIAEVPKKGTRVVGLERVKPQLR